MEASCTRLFTRAELKTRNKREDAVLIIHNGVYDVSKFLEEILSARSFGSMIFLTCEEVELSELLIIKHPGGEEVLLEQAGKDATEPFEDVSHSSDARALMQKYKIGELVEEDRTQEKTTTPSWTEDKPQEQGNAWSSWVTPVVLGVAATLLYRYLFA